MSLQIRLGFYRSAFSEVFFSKSCRKLGVRRIHECLRNLFVAKVGFSTNLFAFEYDTADIYSTVPLTLLGSSVSWSGMQSPGNAVLFFSTTAVTLFSLLSSTDVPAKTNWLCSVYYSVFTLFTQQN